MFKSFKWFAERLPATLALLFLIGLIAAFGVLGGQALSDGEGALSAIGILVGVAIGLFFLFR